MLASVVFLVRTSFELRRRERNVHLKLDRNVQVSHLPGRGVESPGSLHSFRRLINRRYNIAYYKNSAIFCQTILEGHMQSSMYKSTFILQG